MVLCNTTFMSGAVLISLTITVKRFVVLKGGVPLSAAITTRLLMPGPWVSSGLQEKIPDGLMALPAGGFNRISDSWSPGRSMSLAVMVNVSSVPSSIERCVIGAMIGASFTGVTVTWNVLVTA